MLAARPTPSAAVSKRARLTPARAELSKIFRHIYRSSAQNRIKFANAAVDRILRIVYNMLSKGLFRHSTGNGGRRKHIGGSAPQKRKLKLNANNNKTQSASSLAFAA